MKAVVQRVSSSEVRVAGRVTGKIGKGILVLLAVHGEDTAGDAERLADKCAALRIFEDGSGKLSLSARDIGGEVLVVSQFTLYGDAWKGNRPNFMAAAPPEKAEQLYERFVARVRSVVGSEKVATGVFREMMEVELVNDGPVTIIMETRENE